MFPAFNKQADEMATSSLLKYLQGWIGVVALMALGNTISCYRNHEFLAERLYTGAPQEVNGLMARLFGVWTLLAALLRLYCAYNIRNVPLYNLTFASFVLALLHFVLEAFVYKTAPITVGVIAPLVVSGVSTLWMLVCYPQVLGYSSNKDGSGTDPHEVKRVTLQHYRKQQHQPKHD